jgi:hypothetical protein
MLVNVKDEVNEKQIINKPTKRHGIDFIMN